MDNLFKYLVLSTLVLVMMSSASAIFNDVNAFDANHVKHANKGEDFNIAIYGGAAADVNSDFNYMVVLSYNGVYVDLNIRGWQDAGYGAIAGRHNAGGDGNVVTRTLIASGTGPCASAIDVNVLSLDGVKTDTNTFNIMVTVPTTGQIQHLVGKEINVELWPLTDQNTSGTIPTASCGYAADANGVFIIGPAIIIRTPNESNLIAKVDQNIAVFGFGFSPNTPDNYANDTNISFWDANQFGVGATVDGSQLVSVIVEGTTNGDLNIFDLKEIGYWIFSKYHLDGNSESPFRDVNSLVMDSMQNYTTEWFGWSVFADGNGEFDINITVPYVTSQAGGTIGRTDLNTLRAHDRILGDVNAPLFVIAPKITEPADMNATITISGNTYSITDAMMKRLITNLSAVSNFIVRMGSIVDNTGNRAIVVKFNSDVNFAKTGIADYSTDMNGRSAYVNINSTNLPEFAIDANIYMYNIKVASSRMPNLLKDGKPCPSTVCTNLDGTTLSENSTTWAYNSAAGDGNLSFRVSTFSSYQASELTVQMVTPNGGEKIRKPRHGADGNYTMQFTLTDYNTSDNNIALTGGAPMTAQLYFSTEAGANTGMIINDTNLFDFVGIRCNGWNAFSDANLASGVNCVFDMNRADLNRVYGEFLVDVNVTARGGRDLNVSALDSSDANVFFNPPLIEITDVNLNTVENFQINGHSNSVKYGVASLDINYVIDFNIYLPDVNIDQNFTLGDYNIHFFLSGSQGALTNDLNISAENLDQNFGPENGGSLSVQTWVASGVGDGLGCEAPFKMECLAPPAAAPYLDFDCNAQFDTNNVIEGMYYLDVRLMNNKSRTVFNKDGGTTVAETIDVNELWDINSSTLNFTVNDNNVPRASFGSSYGVTETIVHTRTYTTSLSCDDNTSGAQTYFVKEYGGSWQAVTGNTFTADVISKNEVTRVFYGGCLDYAGNTSDINATLAITFKPQGGGEGTTPSGAGPGGPGAPSKIGTETIILVETKGTPNASDVRSVLEEAGLSEEEIAAAMGIASTTAIDQKVLLDKITTAVGSTYRTAVSIKVTNHSSKKWRNVKVVANIPKGLAANASQVSSDFAMRVLKADPIIEFTVPEIQVGQTVEVIYFVSKSISDVTAAAIPLGMVVSYAQTEPCDGVTCESTSCATGTCNNATGTCDYEYKADGTACGANKVCTAGTCVEKAAPPAQPEQPEQPSAPDYTMPIVVVVIIIVVIAGVAFYMKKGKRKGR